MIFANDKERLRVLVFQSPPPPPPHLLPSATAAAAAARGGGSEEDKQGLPTQTHTHTVYESDMSEEEQQATLALALQALTHTKGEPIAASTQLKETLIHTHGPLWHVIFSRAGEGMGAAVEAEEGTFLDAKVQKYRYVYRACCVCVCVCVCVYR
jgi:hypothetical protein